MRNRKLRDPNPQVQYLAVKKLNEQDLLQDIAENDPYWTVRREAVWKVTNVQLLERLAEDDSRENVRDAANERLISLGARSRPGESRPQEPSRTDHEADNSAQTSVAEEQLPDFNTFTTITANVGVIYIHT